MSSSEKRVVIVGGGLVGSLNACFFAQRGWAVELFEGRPDIRLEEHVPGRSINLALSTRGRSALAAVELEGFVAEQGIPMHARLVHDPDGTLHRLPYGRPGQFITSINRRHLNEVMLSAAEAQPNVRVRFLHKLRSFDPRSGTLRFFREDSQGGEVSVEGGELLLACDGAYSALRRSLINAPLFNFSQEYIQHGYIELNILPRQGEKGAAAFAMEPNVFHLWPRGQFTLIALANMDATFTVTLFAPWTVLDTLKADTASEAAALVAFFEEQFPDATELLGREAIVGVFAATRPSPLVSVKTQPHHLAGRVLLMGDAAHAMVPFYGQGMNAGFEDCLILSEILNKCNDHIPATLEAYSASRCEDAQAINDLAMYNYLELRDLVNSPLFKARKLVDGWLHRLLGPAWVPLYSMVTFSRTPYAEVVRRRARQDLALGRAVSASALLGLALASRFVYRRFKDPILLTLQETLLRAFHSH